MADLPRGKGRITIELLGDLGSAYGLELVEKSKGALKRGTVYVTLVRLQESGFVVSKLVAPPQGQGGPPRRTFSLTGLGQRAYDFYIGSEALLHAV